jgi:hypothetical protein
MNSDLHLNLNFWNIFSLFFFPGETEFSLDLLLFYVCCVLMFFMPLFLTKWSSRFPRGIVDAKAKYITSREKNLHNKCCVILVDNHWVQEKWQDRSKKVGLTCLESSALLYGKAERATLEKQAPNTFSIGQIFNWPLLWPPFWPPFLLVQISHCRHRELHNTNLYLKPIPYLLVS